MTLLEQELYEQMKQINILMRVNNVLLSKFIIELQSMGAYLNIPKRIVGFKFWLSLDDYKELCSEFAQKDVDKAFIRLDQMMAANKVECPNNIKRYIKAKLKKQSYDRIRYKENHPDEKEGTEE